MRAPFVGLLAISVIILATASGTAAQRWCAISYEGASNCAFETMDLCRAATSGTGGFCIPEAPVGHRQPTTSSVGKPPPQDQLGHDIEKMNRHLDRSLEICRGCR
jgi:Protein of unknown function (DUF3551)